MFLLFLSCDLSVESKTVRQNELDCMINTAMNQTINELKNDGTISKEELQADLLARIEMQRKSDSSITIKSMIFQETKGLLSVEAEEHFTYPNGAKGTVKTAKNMVIEP
jgi:hypothetical protein